MSEFLPLIAGFRANDPVGWSDGKKVTAAQFCATALELAERLPPKRYVFNLCGDRLRFALGLAAALIARQITLLPYSTAPGAVRDLAAAHPDSYCLADDAEQPAGLPAIVVPPWRPAAGAFEVPAVPASLPALTAFTSGSTGRPQPHSRTWDVLVAGARALASSLGIVPSEHFAFLGTVPPQHVYGFEMTVMLPLQNGAAVHPGRPLLPADIAAALEEMTAPRWLVTTPAHLNSAVGSGARVPALAGMLCATMPLAPELAVQTEALWSTPVTELYGTTETGVIARRRPTSGAQWRTVDGVRLHARGEDVWAEGAHVAVPMRLPDRISLESATAFTLLGRPEDMVKIAGKRASLQDLNRELLAVRGVRDGVFFMPETHGKRSPRLAAVAVAPGCTAGEIVGALRVRIDSAFLPRPLVLVDALPRNAMGKLPREALLALTAPARRRPRSA
jgi:acyl-coenzyme A synthetase/AMP-(fatty) acid ligase